MSATVALATELTATNALLQQTITRVSANELAIRNLAIQLGLDEAKIAALTPPVVVVPPPVVIPPYDPQVLWRASTLADWTAGGGGEAVNDAGCTSITVGVDSGVTAHSGTSMIKQTVNALHGGTRLQRYPEVDALCRAGTKFYWSWWDYFVTPISFSPADMFMLWGWVSAAAGASAGDVFFGLYFQNTGNTLVLGYNPTSRASLGSSAAWRSSVQVPIGQWNKFEIEMLPRGDVTGSVRVWLNGASIFEVLGIQTQYPLNGQPLLSYQEQTAYGSNLTPTPYSHYIDDVSLSLGRMP